MSLPIPLVTKNAVEKMVCYTGPDVKVAIVLTNKLVVQIVGWSTSADGIDTICLSDGDFCYPFLIADGIRPQISPFCTIELKKISKYPVEDPHHPGITISVFTLEDMRVVVSEYDGIIGNPVDIRKAKLNYDIQYPLLNHWDSSWYTPPTS